MIPVSLSIEGLYSYQKKQIIDFQRLTASQLFGIFGATGSGKSSILEAVTLALYNECERLNRNLRNYNLMNLRSHQLQVDFSFKLQNSDAELYRFVVQGKRHKKYFDRVSYERQAYEWIGGNWQPITLPDAAQLLGLSYDNFKRTVIIPQGKFREFIELNHTARSKMLNDIFGLDKYQLTPQVKTLIYQNDQAIAKIEALLQKLEDITSDSVKALQSEIDTLTASWEAFSRKRTTQQKQLDLMASLKQQVEHKESLQKQLQALLSQQLSFQQREQKLNAYTRCLNQFRETLNKRKQLTQELDDLQRELDRTSELILQHSQEVKQAKHTLESVEKSYHERHLLLEKSHAFNQIISLKETAKYLEHLKQRKEKGQNLCEETQSERQKSRQAVKVLEEEVAKLKQLQPNPQLLLQMQQWWSQQKMLRDKEVLIQKQWNTLQEEINLAKQKKRKLLKNTFLDVRQYELPTTKLISLIGNETQRLEALQETLNRQKEEMLVKNQLHQLVENLSTGEPCPLCGATEHPEPLDSENLLNQIQQLDQQLQVQKAQLKVLSQVQPRLEELALQASQMADKLKTLSHEWESCKEQLEAHQRAWTFTNQPADDQQVARMTKEYEQIQQQLANKERSVAALKSEEEALEKKLGEYQLQLEEVQQNLSEKYGQWQSQKEALQRVSYDEWHTYSDTQLREQALEAQSEHTQIEKLYKEIFKQIEDKQSQLHTQEGIRQARQARYKTVAQLLAQLNQTLQQEINQSDFNDLKEVEHILDLNLNIDAERKAVDEFKSALTETKTRLHDIELKIGDQNFELEAYELLNQELETLKSHMDDTRQQIGAHKHHLSIQRQQLAEKTEYEKKLEQLQKRRENLKVLSNLFRGDGFVRYVSAAYLENLCATANHRFMRLTHNALSLEVDEDNQFHVRDRLNDGRKRSIKTLSGGQTFQAALCLALALSEQVQQQFHTHQNFFFLDEGFGSLDKDSLRLIFQTLQTLQKEQRIVGIISHVEELQQEIDTYLHVSNDPEKGSRIIGSWE